MLTLLFYPVIIHKLLLINNFYQDNIEITKQYSTFSHNLQFSKVQN